MKTRLSKFLLSTAILALLTIIASEPPDDVYAEVSHCGALSGDETWSASDNVHILTCDVTIPPGVTLTIEPGAIIKGQTNTRLIVQGALDARGTADNPIVFTSINDDVHGGDTDGDGTATPPTRYDWGWIEFADSSDDAASFLEHCLILYGGKDYVPYVDLYDGAITLHDAAPTVVNCTFQHNYINGIEIPGGTKSASASGNTETWHNADVVYVVTGDLMIAPGMKLVINPSVTVKFKSNTRLVIQGALDARGTVSDLITFTSFNDDAHGGDTDDDGADTPPSPNDWAWIEFADSSNDAASFLEYCLVLYGGKDYVPYVDLYYGAVRLIAASPTIANCTFSYNGNYAIGADTGSFPTVYANTMTNNSINGIGLYGGTISADGAHWTSTDAVYVLDDDITVATGKMLTITPGVIIKGQINTRLIVQGALDARGTADNPIVFTSINDDNYGGDTDGDGTATPPAKYDWGWIEFADSSDDAVSFLEHCLILYGGKDYVPYVDLYDGAITLHDAAPTVANCAFQHNYINGIEIPGGTKSASASGNTETWHNADVVYVVTGDLTIAPGMKLVINPSVTVKFKSNTRLVIQGALDARGTASDLITFTSFNDDAHGGDTDDDGANTPPSPNDWAWIEFADSSDDAASFLEYCLVLYGGKDYVPYIDLYYGAVRLIAASPTIANCTFSHNGNYAIGADTGSFPTVYGNMMTNNGINGIGLYGGTISADGAHWTSTDAAYVLDDDITVATGKMLTITPGAIIKGQTNTRLIVQGALDARGTADNPIVFTSINDDNYGGDTDGDGTTTPPARYDWGWIEFADSSDDAASFLEHCLILYGGKDYVPYIDLYDGAITLYNAAPTISYTALVNNYRGIEALDGSIPNLTCNDVYSNTGYGIFNNTPLVPSSLQKTTGGATPLVPPILTIPPELASQSAMA